MKIHWMMIITIILLLLVVLAECGYQLVGANYNVLATAEKRIKSYCAGENMDFISFDVPRIHNDQQYDFCIEYITTTNVHPRHIVLLFFKNGKIVEEHRDIQ